MNSSCNRKAAMSVLLFSVSTLAGCAVPLKPPPEISYDDEAQPAVQLADPPKPVEVVEIPKLLPLPGQLKPLHGTPSKPESGDPRKRVEKANAAARVQPTRNGYINAVQVYPFSPGRSIRSSGAGTGDRRRLAGRRATRRFRPGRCRGYGALDHRRYRERSRPDQAHPYPGQTHPPGARLKSGHQHRSPDLSPGAALRGKDLHGVGVLAISARPTDRAAPCKTPVPTLRRQLLSGVDISRLRFRYAIEGDNPPWRPVSAFDDGSKVYIEMPSGIAQGEAPPLFVIGPEGDGQLVNYRVRQNYYIVDRLFAAAELRMGGEHQQTVRISRTDGRTR